MTALCRDVYDALVNGRGEVTPAIVSSGSRGGEGKSVFLKPLWTVIGREFVFATPEKGNFPLLGLEQAKVVFLDDWRFKASVLSYSTQCLWYDGSAVPIARPQNVPGASGHGLYAGTAPIFVTTKEQGLQALRAAAEEDPETGEPRDGEAPMILRRLKVCRFRVRVAKPARQLPYCARCFARLLLTKAGVIEGPA